MMTDARELPFDPAAFKAGFEPTAISLDDVEVSGMGGVVRRPFAGETVWVEPFLDPEDERALVAAYARMGVGGEEVDDAFAALCEVMSRIVYAWDCTDKHGKPYPQPHRNPGAFTTVPTKLLFALITRLMAGAEGGADPGKELGGSPPTSSAKRARRNR